MKPIKSVKMKKIVNKPKEQRGIYLHQDFCVMIANLISHDLS